MSTYFVAKNGSNSNPGTETSPFLTVVKGVSVLNPGDTLFLRAGTYSEGGHVVNSPSGTSSNRITIAGYQSEVVTLSQAAIQFTGASYVTLEKVVLRDQLWVGNGCHHMIFQDLEITDSDAHGIQNDTPGPGYNQYLRIRIHDVGGDSYSNAIYTNDSNALFDGIEIYNCCGTSMQIYHSGGAPVNDCVVRNCYVHDTSGQWMVDNRPQCMLPSFSDNGKGQGILVRGSNNLLYNNIVEKIDSSPMPCNLCGSGITLFGGGNNNRVYHNTVSGMVDSPNYSIAPGQTNAKFINNISANWQNPSGQIEGEFIDHGSNTEKHHNIFSATNPLFVG